MAQHDLDIANGSGAAVRADINDALKALGSTMKGASAPSAPLAGMQWVEDDNPSSSVWTLRVYDGTDWINVYRLDSTNNVAVNLGHMDPGSSGVPGLPFYGDTNTGFASRSGDNMDIITGGTARINVDSGGFVGVGADAQSSTRLRVVGTGSSSATKALLVQTLGGSTILECRNDGLVFLPVTQSTHTSASAANVFMGSSGELYISTSSERYKQDIRPMEPGACLLRVMAWQPVTFEEKGKPGPRFAGFTAEAMAALDDGSDIYVVRNKEGQPNALNYANMVADLTGAVQALAARLAVLEAA